jgi:hypothetical protein
LKKTGQFLAGRWLRRRFRQGDNLLEASEKVPGFMKRGAKRLTIEITYRDSGQQTGKLQTGWKIPDPAFFSRWRKRG